MYFLRSCYYNLIGKFATVQQIEHFTGFGLYDKKFIEVLRDLHDPMPYIKGIVAELGFKRKEVTYEQQNGGQDGVKEVFGIYMIRQCLE